MKRQETVKERQRSDRGRWTTRKSSEATAAHTLSYSTSSIRLQPGRQSTCRPSNPTGPIGISPSTHDDEPASLSACTPTASRPPPARFAHLAGTTSRAAQSGSVCAPTLLPPPPPPPPPPTPPPPPAPPPPPQPQPSPPPPLKPHHHQQQQHYHQYQHHQHQHQHQQQQGGSHSENVTMPSDGVQGKTVESTARFSVALRRQSQSYVLAAIGSSNCSSAAVSAGPSPGSPQAEAVS